MLDRYFWKDKKVFLTGHTGFKGSWLITLLSALGAKCKGYALLPPTSPSMYNIIKGDNLCNSVIADIRNFSNLKRELEIFNPDIVIHMAAQPLVLEGYKNPLNTYETNVIGTVNILEAVRCVKGVKAVVNVTTDKVYENNHSNIGYNENDRLGGYDPYSNSKACSELVTSCYRNSFFNIKDFSIHGCGVATVRSGNVLGGGDFANDRLVPDIIRAVTNNKKMLIRNGSAIRPWQHVLEPLFCYLVVAQNIIKKGAEYCTSFNIAPDKDNCCAVIDILNIFSSFEGFDFEFEVQQGEYHETNILLLDNTKAKKMLGFSPVYGIETVLRKIADWTKEYLQGGNMQAYTLKQVNEFLDENNCRG